MAYPRGYYGPHERDEAKVFLKLSRAARTELGNESTRRWLTSDGTFWIERDTFAADGDYALFLEQKKYDPITRNDDDDDYTGPID